VFSDQVSNAATQTVQTASPVCGTKNFSSVRLYSAPQLHWTIVAIPGNMSSEPPLFQPGTLPQSN
jgi:FtsP/CotA-like multicopper oxidase with cupredoxin domain